MLFSRHTKRRTFIAGLGSTAAWPLVARAQESMPLVGFLYLGNSFGISLGSSLANLTAFRQGLAEAGFVEGKNVRFEFHGRPSTGIWRHLRSNWSTNDRL